MSNVHIRTIEDASGDLIDLEYFHHGCSPDDVPSWPCPESVDYPVYCEACGDRVEAVPLTLAGRHEYGELEPDELEQEARRLGAAAGIASASWPEFDALSARRVLAGMADGDPETLDSLPWLDLSGQWADGPDARTLLEGIGMHREYQEREPELADDILTAYQSAHDDAMQEEVERRARYYAND